MKKLLIMALLMCPLCLFAGEPEGVIMPGKPDRKPYVDYSVKKQGFWAAAELGAGPSIHITPGFKSSLATEVDLTGGYRFNQYCQVGLGVGVRYYLSASDRVDVKAPDRRTAFPIYANARGVMIDSHARGVVPYWSASAGYTVFDGVFFSPTIGIRVGTMERHHFLVGLSYVLQQTCVVKSDATRLDGVLNSVQLKLGYQF